MKSSQIPQSLRDALRGANTAWIFDVDDTITDTRAMHHEAVEPVAQALSQYLPAELARATANRFGDIFDHLLARHQQQRGVTSGSESASQLEERARSHQQEILKVWGTARLFSREVLLQIALEDCGGNLNPRQLRSCTDAYWDFLSSNPILFPDAVQLIQELAHRNISVYLMTSSDAHYNAQTNGQFTYSPEDSRSKKNRRLKKLREHGIQYVRAFVGDPVDKPTEEFFQLVFAGVSDDLRQDLDDSPIVVVGDSYKSDIETPLRLLNTAAGIWYRKGQNKAEAERERVFSVGSFTDCIDSLDEYAKRGKN